MPPEGGFLLPLDCQDLVFRHGWRGRGEPGVDFIVTARAESHDVRNAVRTARDQAMDSSRKTMIATHLAGELLQRKGDLRLPVTRFQFSQF